MSVSADFAKFAAQTTKGKFDEARKAESLAGGCPLPIGTSSTAVIGDIVCTTTKKKEDGTGGDPQITIKLEVETPEEHQGAILNGSGLIFWIKDSANQDKATAWHRFLDALEDMGLDRKVRANYEDFQEVLDYMTKTTRRVDYSVEKDDFKGNRSGKTVRAIAHVDESNIPTADGGSTEAAPALDPDADYVLYLAKPHMILADNGDTYNLQGPSGTERPNVPKSKTSPYKKPGTN